MVHRRSAMGAWKHAQRSFLRGYRLCPPVFTGVELPPPPPPPVFLGVEKPGPRNRHWDDFWEEEDEDLHIGKADCQAGFVAFLVDAPLTAKDISLPKRLCLSALLEPDLLDSVAVSSPIASCDTETRTVEKDVLETFSLSSSVYEERNVALLSELGDVKRLVASIRSESDCMRAELEGELKEMRVRHSEEMKKSLVSLSEACFSAVAATRNALRQRRRKTQRSSKQTRHNIRTEFSQTRLDRFSQIHKKTKPKTTQSGRRVPPRRLCLACARQMMASMRTSNCRERRQPLSA